MHLDRLHHVGSQPGPHSSGSELKSSRRARERRVATQPVGQLSPPAAESSVQSAGHGVPWLQALQASHAGLEASSGPSHVPVGQHESHETPPPPEAPPPPESAGHVSCWYWQGPLQASHALQASHRAPRLAAEGRIEFSAKPGRLQIQPRQRFQILPPEPGLPPAAEIRPLLEIDITGLTRLQAERSAALGMQVPSGPLQ